MTAYPRPTALRRAEPMDAKVAESGDFGVLHDAEGGLWAHSRSGWRYLTQNESGDPVWSWDVRPWLPEEYEPYFSAHASTRALLKHVKTS